MRTRAAFIGIDNSLLHGHTDEHPSIDSTLQSDIYFNVSFALQSLVLLRRLPKEQ